MPPTIPSLKANLKGLKAVRRAIVFDATADIRQQTGLTILTEAQIVSQIDTVLTYLSITKSPDASGDPILVVTSRVIDIDERAGNRSFIGTSLVLLDDILLPRTFTWVPPVTSAIAPHNAKAEIWSANDTATVEEDHLVVARLLSDVGRLLTAFASDWREANA